MIHRALILFSFIALFPYSLTICQDSVTIEQDTCTISVSETLSRDRGDRLLISCNCPIVKFKFSIYNRWGEILYHTDTLSDFPGFDIAEKNEQGKEIEYKFPHGMYVWYAEYLQEEGTGQVKKSKKGIITIVEK